MSGVKGIIRSVKNVALQYSDIEVKVREATSNDRWGASSSQMAEIARATNDYEAYPHLFAMLWKRLNDQEHYLHVQKALLLVDYLLRNGSERFVQDAKRRKNDLLRLQEYRSYNADGEDVAKNCRNKAAQIYATLDSDSKIEEERTKAARVRPRVGNAGYAEPSLNRWQCPRCTFLNPWERQECEMCDTTKPYGAQAIAPSEERKPQPRERDPSPEREQPSAAATAAAEEERRRRKEERKRNKEHKKKHRKPEGEEGGEAGDFAGAPTDPFAVAGPVSSQYGEVARGDASFDLFENPPAQQGNPDLLFQPGPSYGAAPYGGGFGRPVDWTQDFVEGVSATRPALPGPDYKQGQMLSQPVAGQPVGQTAQQQKKDDDLWGLVMGSENILAQKEPEKRHIQTNAAMNQRTLPASPQMKSFPAPVAPLPGGPMGGPFGAPAYPPQQFPPQMYGQPQAYPGYGAPYGQPGPYMGQPMPYQPLGQPLGQSLPPLAPLSSQAPRAQQPDAFGGLAWN